MITLEQKQKLLAALKSHTVSAIRSNQKYKIPVVIDNENVVITRIDIADSDGSSISNTASHQNTYQVQSEDGVAASCDKSIVTYETGKVRFFNQKLFHYDDTWYSYKYSVDEPQYNYGILRVENMPYNTFEGKRNMKSFVCSLNNLFYQQYCEPFMIFINREFVSWNDITVVFDCDDTYLLLYGDKYNWYNLRDAEIHMVILPFKVGFVGEESDERFNMMYEITREYIQDSMVINDDGSFRITSPGIDEVYRYKGMIYNIGAWLYTQLKYDALGILSSNRKERLKRFDIVKREYDNAGNVINTIYTKFNAFDKDSYNIALYNHIIDGRTMFDYTNNSIFRFDANGLLDYYGPNMISLLDDCTYFRRYNYSDKNIVCQDTHTDGILFRENYIVFKNRLFFPDCKMDLSIRNICTIDNPDEDEFDILVFYHNPASRLVTLMDNFNTQYLNEKSYEVAKSPSTNYEYQEYLRLLMSFLDYSYNDNRLYIDNYENAMDAIIKFNPMLISDLYHSNIDSNEYYGYEANESLMTKLDYEDRKGLKIPRHKYESHESYVMVFEDGELIKEYSEMIIYPNFFFIPMERDFVSSSRIEILYFNHIDNNEIHFNLTDYMVENMQSTKFDGIKWVGTDIFNQFIDPKDLKIFCKYPENIIVYDTLVKESNNIAFNISRRASDGNLYLMGSVVDECLNSTESKDELIAVSSRKFIYQRFYVNSKSYRILMGTRFRYCDNPNQYMLFINGRRICEDSFFITIPKHTRPFWGMYLYLTKFVGPEDRVELFYVPEALTNINSKLNLLLEEHGYLRTNKEDLEVPFDNRYYMIFVNGKKIPAKDIITVDTHTVRIAKDQQSMNNLMINRTYSDTIDEVSEYMADASMLSEYDSFINFILNSTRLSRNELDNLFNVHEKMSDTEINMVKSNVNRIAILNEIVRDFWVTSGYDYNEEPFVYDYDTDELIVKDANNNLIIPALDAAQYANIIKNDTHLLYYYHNPDGNWFEIGSTINAITFFWEYSTNLYGISTVLGQTISYKPDSSKDDEIKVVLGIDSREWSYSNPITSDTTFHFIGKTSSQIIDRVSHIKFANCIYYGAIDEDSLQHYGKDSALGASYLQNMLYGITTACQPSPEVTLDSYIIGNNNYFMYACPKRYAFDGDSCLIDFVLPDLKDPDLVMHLRDDKTTPVYTSGHYGIDTNNLLESLDSMNMILLDEIEFVNRSGYAETYCVWRSNGFFTRLMDDYGIKIVVKFKESRRSFSFDYNETIKAIEVNNNYE